MQICGQLALPNLGEVTQFLDPVKFLEVQQAIHQQIERERKAPIAPNSAWSKSGRNDGISVLGT